MLGVSPTPLRLREPLKRVGDKAGAYVALLIDDPALLQPLRANLFQSDPRTHVLMWSRPLIPLIVLISNTDFGTHPTGCFCQSKNKQHVLLGHQV